MSDRTVRKSLVLLIVAAAQFMVVLDTSIVNVALPAIFQDLGFTSASHLQWVVTAYTLAFGGFLLLGGRAADLYGRRKLFMGAVGTFALTSLVCGLAQSPLMLEISRAIQGLSAAFMSPAALSIVLTTFREGAERAKALSVWGAVAAGGAATGVLLGGVLTQYLDWRWNFFVNVPVGLLLAAAAWRFVPESRADLDHKQLDLPGAVLVTTGLIVLVFGFTQAADWGWTDLRTLGLLAAALVLLAGFIRNEQRSRHPLLPLGIFRVGNVRAANLTQLPVTAAMFSLFFFLSLYVQNVLGYSPLVSGVSFLPITAIIGLVSVAMPRLIARIGYKKPMVIAPLLMAGGLLYLSRIRVDGTYWADVFPGMALMALGMGMLFISVTIAATSGVPARQSGLASGLLNTSQQVGGALGLAILSGVFTAAANNYAASQPSLESEAIVFIGAQVHGYRIAFLAAAGFVAVAALIAGLYVRHVKAAAEPAGSAIHV